MSINGLRPRISVFLMVHKNSLYKSLQFSDYTYMGDPLNAVRIFNDFGVDELILMDIDASVNSLGPNFDLISAIAQESRMPLCYGGGISNAFEVEKIVKAGVEKVSLSSQAIKNPKVIKSIAENFGSQSISCCLDIKKPLKEKDYKAYIHNGMKKMEGDILETINSFQSHGAGEIIINNIDRDGTLDGFDIEIIKKIYSILDIPLTAIGGASSLTNISELINQCGLIGVGAGRLWSLVGENRSVLLNYPNKQERANFFLNL
jgi:cyclase